MEAPAARKKPPPPLFDGTVSSVADASSTKPAITSREARVPAPREEGSGLKTEEQRLVEFEAAKETKERTDAGNRPVYTRPAWGRQPTEALSLEVLRAGSIIGNLDISQRDCYCFGRHDRSDFVLEHPSASRFHAILQHGGLEGDGVGCLSGSSCGVYVYDLDSTHGTFVNKRRVKPNVHVPLQVGDMLKFGLSTRSYILQGPPELMPEEGLSKAERQALRRMEAEEAARVRQQHLLLAQQNAAASSGASWGFGEDAVNEEDEEDEEVTWENYKGTMTEKQQKHAEKLRKKQEKMDHLRAEISNIQAKEMSQGGLTQGQQTQISRNEQRVDEIMREYEELEETLNESIRESIRGRSSNKEGPAKGKAAKRKGGTFLDSDDEGGDSDDDDFYDRSAALLRKRQRQAQRGVARGSKHGAGGQGGARAQVETAESLWCKRAELEHRLSAAEADLAQEQALAGVALADTAPAPALGAAAGGDPAQNGGVGKVGGAAPASAHGGHPSMGAGDEGLTRREQGGVGEERADASVDPLDAFMTRVTSQVERDGVLAARRRLEDLRAEYGRVCALLRVADPSGLFVPSAGNRVAAATAAARTLKEEAEARVKASRPSAVAAGVCRDAQGGGSQGDVPRGMAEGSGVESGPGVREGGNHGSNGGTARDGSHGPGQVAGPGGAGGPSGTGPAAKPSAEADRALMPPPAPVPTPQWLGAPKPAMKGDRDSDRDQGRAGSVTAVAGGQGDEELAGASAMVFLERKELRGAAKGATGTDGRDGVREGAGHGDGVNDVGKVREPASESALVSVAGTRDHDGGLLTATDQHTKGPAAAVVSVTGASGSLPRPAPPGAAPRSYGPTMPPALARRNEEESEEEEGDGGGMPKSPTTAQGHAGVEGPAAIATKETTRKPMPVPRKAKAGAAAAAGDAEELDSVWAPPEGQTGDGMTSLNAKFGY